MIENRHVVADADVRQADAGVNAAARANGRLALEHDAGSDGRVRTDRDVFVDVRRLRIVERHAVELQRPVLSGPHDAAEIGEIDAAVHAAQLIRRVEQQRLDRQPPLAIDRDEIGQVVLALRVVGRESV